ncbi:hypothetical protein CPB86DRAFT_819051 [Serendipita vermifera]|nr:hypothetical protein CPB86DRAFT_819051 [Serendipita vermifera]
MSTVALPTESTNEELVYDGLGPRHYVRRDETLYTEETVQGHSLTNNFFTFTFWVRMNNKLSPVDEILVINEDVSSIRVRMNLNYETLKDGEFMIELRTRGKPKAPVLLPFTRISEEWAHVAIIRNEGDLTVYFNETENHSNISDYLPTVSMPNTPVLTLQIAFNRTEDLDEARYRLPGNICRIRMRRKAASKDDVMQMRAEDDPIIRGV